MRVLEQLAHRRSDHNLENDPALPRRKCRTKRSDTGDRMSKKSDFSRPSGILATVPDVKPIGKAQPTMGAVVVELLAECPQPLAPEEPRTLREPVPERIILPAEVIDRT